MKRYLRKALPTILIIIVIGVIILFLSVLFSSSWIVGGQVKPEVNKINLLELEQQASDYLYTLPVFETASKVSGF